MPNLRTEAARAAVVLGSAIVHESLRENPHVITLKPLLASAKRAIKKRWTKQRAAVNRFLSASTIKEAALTKSQLAFLAAAALLAENVYDSDQLLADVVEEAETAGARHGADVLGIPIVPLASFMVARLVKAALDGVDRVTAERVEDEIINSDNPSASVDMLFRDMTTGVVSRLDSIAGIAVNGAYNAGIAAEATAGDAERYWATEANPCVICQANEAEGWIGPDRSFSSGDEAPPAHVNCQCSLDVRRVVA